MKLQLLPTTFDENGQATAQQHLCCFVINDCVAIDAGSLATSTNKIQKENIRDVVLTHAHLDHIAGLPLFIDDLFANLDEPIRIHATQDVIDALENFIFNWTIYPRFSELKNDNGEIIEYKSFQVEQEFAVKDLTFKPLSVNHKVPTVGFIINDDKSKIAISGDTSEMETFWDKVNQENALQALLIECAFPNQLTEIAHSSHHLTPKTLSEELKKLTKLDCPIYIINIKPMYYEQVVSQINELQISNLKILEVGRVYEF